jgi:hypothetical protein
MWMLLWPFLEILFVAVSLNQRSTPEGDRKTFRQFKKKVISKYFLGTLLFEIFFYGFKIFSGSSKYDFDPSGHVCCQMVAISLYMTIHSFAKSHAKTQELVQELVQEPQQLKEETMPDFTISTKKKQSQTQESKPKTISRETNSKETISKETKPTAHKVVQHDDSLPRVTQYILWFFIAHGCYSLFFSTFIFHSRMEVLVGALFGKLICWLTFGNDVVSDLVSEIPSLFMANGSGSKE